VVGANLYHFGVISSLMHMAWVRHICGRLKSDYRYSNELVYNNYPWPEVPSKSNMKAVEKAAEAVINIRGRHKNTLAELYDPLSMPKDLLQAHQELDRCVDLCYRSQKFVNERKRIEYLLELFKKCVEPLNSSIKSK